MEAINTRSKPSGDKSSGFKDYQGVIIAGVCLFAFAPLVLIFLWWKNKYYNHHKIYYNQTYEVKGTVNQY